ncbi:hypothetical protein ABB37_09266 [Leptomonas pyrrhocoris]|uniref:Uncharacterized protein n=1 Tax=Leptomonas pyrrhocoris TaxID=157538 RepID=A0A0N1J491_LEPPY|nr:hypothetical protein ABB37_09266 [Leptomonas pyrrhocoris]XP_015652698.1 hypothetical protein ABB37_09266 [Leptomonas pyrrhocoris]XP_015652699.1 hypothetical protein ABB37_09266 [Leptomonas pyrrhocoris]KPA74258.1 hypothetical protein ABB37_09266 [Leptomonas pyrrhocoris]KPA74259.1 hypothetical protein ABB37_09266 [Leptomonas pyrrhocoris]KPA74260.1 hypothetical protein ABB37_09266 [Leptomonas pyrrhocoris]|eukprot:XP_015652697.1 hypothetical protein ABB37_09266 [Leptomonas pyrrhocoris]
MSCTPPLPPLRTTAERCPCLDALTRLDDPYRWNTEGDPSLLFVNTTVSPGAPAGQHNVSINAAAGAASLPQERFVGKHGATRHPTTSTGVPDPQSPIVRFYPVDGPSLTSTSAPAGVVAQQTFLAALIDRFMALLMPSTERLLRVRAALKGLRDSLGGVSPSASTPAAAPPTSPSYPSDLSVWASQRLSNTSETALVPPRLCVTGVADADVDDVFQFLLHRDAAMARCGSSGLEPDRRSGLHSAGSAMRLPRPDSGWATPTHLPPWPSAAQRRPRIDVYSSTAVAGRGETAGGDGAATRNGANPFPAVSPTDSAGMAVWGSGLLSSSSTTLSDDAAAMVVTPPLSSFPTTPPHPLSGFARVMTEVDRGRSTDTLSPGQLALPTLQHRAESGSSSAFTRERYAELPPMERNGIPHTVFAASKAGGPAATTTGPSPTTNPTTTTTAAYPCARSPHPPLPAAPANNNLRTAKSSPYLESDTLRSSPVLAGLQRESSGGGGVVAAGESTELSTSPPPVPTERTGNTVVMCGAADTEGAGEEAADAASLSSTIPDLGDTTPPTVALRTSSMVHRVPTTATDARAPLPYVASPLASPVETGAPFRRRTAVQSGEPPTVLLNRTASQHSGSGEPQRSLRRAASGASRSGREDSTVLSPGSSFSPAATRFVRRLRRRSVAFTAAQLRLTAWDLFHPERLTEQDRAFLRAARNSISAVTSPELVGRSQRRGGDEGDAAGGGAGAAACVPRRQSSPQLSPKASPVGGGASSSGTGALPWMVGISEDGMLRCEAPPNAHTAASVTASLPVATTSDYCLLCIPFEAACCLPREPSSGGGHSPAAADCFPGAAANTDEVTRALNVLFGPFAGSRPRRRSALPATSVFVTPENPGSPAAAAATAVGFASNRGGSSAGDNQVASLSSPPFSTLVSPTREAVGTFVFPALGRVGSGSEVWPRESERSWRRTPSPSLERSVDSEHRSGGGGGGGALDGWPSRAPAAESPGHDGLSSVSARNVALFLRNVTERLGGGGGGDGGSTVDDSQSSVAPGALLAAATEEWLCPLRQALVHRVVFVLVNSTPPSSSPPAESPSLPRKPSAAHATVVHNFVSFVQRRYGVAVPPWRVVVFSYRDSVITRNFLLSYFAEAHTPLPPSQQQAEGVASTTSGPSRDRHDGTPANGGTPAGAKKPSPLNPLLPRLPPLLANGRRGSTLQRLTTLVPTPPDTNAPASTASLRGPRRSSHSSFVRSNSQLTLTNALPGSADDPCARSHPDSEQEEGGEVAARQSEDNAQDPARATNVLFALLTRDVTVPPLSDSMTVYAPLMSYTSSLAASIMPPVPSPPVCRSTTSLPSLRHVADAKEPREEEDDKAVHSTPTPTTVSMPATGPNDGPLSSTGRHRASVRPLSLLTASEERPQREVTTMTKEERGRSAMACRHALKVMWKESGAAALNSAFRLFEHDAAAHRTSHAAFSLMAWSCQLGTLLPAALKEAQLLCRRLRRSRRRAAQKQEKLQKSIDLHVSDSPAKSIAAVEARVQAGFAAMTRRFAHDVRRLLVAPAASQPAAATRAAAPFSACSGSAAATTTTAPSSASSSRQRDKSSYPPLDALRVYETPALRDAYRRLVYHAQQFRDFYLHGQLPSETGGEAQEHDRDGMDGAQQRSSRAEGGEKGGEGAAGVGRCASLYERRYNALCAQVEALSTTTVEGPREERSASPPTSASTSPRAASVLAAQAPLALPSGGPRSRVSPPGSPPGRASEFAEEPERRPMPRVDRSTPRERRVSMIASVGSSASASRRNSSTSSCLRPSPVETEAKTVSEVGTAGVSPSDRIRDGNTGAQMKEGDLSNEALLPLRHAGLLQRRMRMEHQLIAHVSQINTEIINFFLSTCVAALPHIQRSCVQAEVERLAEAHAEMYSAFATTMYSHKDAAVTVSRMYANLEQWTAEVGPLLSMARSRQYLEKFIAQLRAVLCEDQIRGLAAHRRRCEVRSNGQTAKLTNANLTRYCTSIEKPDQRAEDKARKEESTVTAAAAAAAARQPSQRNPWTSSSADASKFTGAAAAAGAIPSTEVGLRSARLLLYFTRLACKAAPLTGNSTSGGGGGAVCPPHPRGLESTSFVQSPSMRQPRPTSAASTLTSHTSISRRRGGNGGDLDDTASLMSMSAAWNREEDAPRSAGLLAGSISRRSNRRCDEDAAKAGGDGGVLESFYAASSPPCMGAVSAQLTAALGGAPSEPAAPPSVGSAMALSLSRHSRRGHTTLTASEDSVLTSSAAPTPPLASHSKRCPLQQRHSRGSKGTADDAAAAGVSDSATTTTTPVNAAWLTRLKKWRARLPESERPADITAAPLLWLLLDTWDETLLRLPYGLLLHLDTARYAALLNSLSKPVMEAQLDFRARLTETSAIATTQLTELESDLTRLQGDNGELRMDYVAALRSIFDEATVLATPPDEAVHARFFA